MEKIAIAKWKDRNFILSHDEYITKKTMLEKIKRKEYIMAKVNDKLVGFLRFGYFWSAIPTIEMIRIEKNFRRKGIGRKMVEFLEKIAKRQGNKFILSSSTGNEKEPQNWHKKIGFKYIGKINTNYPSRIPEVFFIKVLK